MPPPSLGYLPNPGIEPESPALAGEFFTIEPGGEHKREKEQTIYYPWEVEFFAEGHIVNKWYSQDKVISELNSLVFTKICDHNMGQIVS